ncbi:hypothetical protein OROGR_005469 [Orobanche gracilis]
MELRAPPSNTIQVATFTTTILQRSSSSSPFPNAFFPSTSIRGRACKAIHCTLKENKNLFQNPSIDLQYSTLSALCPLDGRYWDKVKELAPFTSEYGLIFYRVLVEIKWLLKLSEIPEIIEVPSFSEDAKSYLQGLIDGFSENDAWKIKDIEKETNHDVKAVEYFLKQKCTYNAEVAKVVEFFHFACTSEDINNLAYGLMLKEAMDSVMFPVMDKLIKALYDMSKDYAHIPMLSRTHGQPASPTTLGKEMAVFAVRLSMERKELSQVEIMGKFAGAVGYYNAHVVAYPDVNWPQTAEEFVKSLGLSFNPCIESHDYMATLFDSLKRFNTVLIDFDSDMWSYISLTYFKQITKAGEIGSSTMPHKVNPIDFENSEVRDLTDSTVLRNVGVGLGYSLVAYKNTLQGIRKLQVNEVRLNEDLDQFWEVLAEAIQTVMRKYNVPEPYEKLKELTRGRSVNTNSIRDFIEGLGIPEAAKMNLLKLMPCTYVGLATQLAGTV